MHGSRLTVRAVGPTDPALDRWWPRLQEQKAVDTPFLTWEWFSSLAESPTLVRDSVVLLVSDAEDDVVGLLPVEVVRVRGARTLRCTGAAELGADHLDVVAVPGDRPAVAAAVARHVVRRMRWDLADFEGLCRDGALAGALHRELRRPRVLPRRPQPEEVSVVQLAGPVGEQARARLRRRSARGLKSAERAGGGYAVVEDPEQVGVALRSLMTMHNDRFGTRSGIFSTPELREFHVRAATRLAGSGLARVGRLSTAERDIALEYVLLLGDRAYSYQSGLVPDGGHSPGRTVMCRSMLTAAEEGRTEYDLLRGDEAYKADYATGARCDVRVRALRPTPGAVLWGLDCVRRRLVASAADLRRRGHGGA